MSKKWTLLLSIAVLFCVVFSAVAGESATGVSPELTWPREIVTPEATITIYQPQLEKFEGNKLAFRFATAVQTPKMKEPVFGAVWAEAWMETDRDKRTVKLVSLETVNTRFPNAKPEKEKRFVDILKKEIPTWNITLSLDRLLAGLEVIQTREKKEQAFNNKPPDIIYMEQPATLVLLDGEPILEPIEKSDLMAVVNTPFPMVFRKQDKTYYLMGRGSWYKAGEVAGKWTEVAKPPADVAAIRPKDEAGAGDSMVDAKMVVIGATKPTELLSIDGKPKFTPFSGNEIMYVENTTSDLLFEVESSRYFLLISGRWYVTKNLEGPWTYVPPEDLPKSFAKIPSDSAKSDLLASVPGTVEAKEAVLDAQVPQTAAINRSEAKLTVEYDGKPKFEKIAGTKIDYALNTATPVIRVNGKYYAVDNGVWFVSSAAKGPWVVADSVPGEVQDIPPSSPVHNIKYVYVYDYTPQVVYVGYTPGYTGCYVHHGVVVYGTGYYYRPWYHHYYYPRPVTWGYSVRYSSYSGWSFGISVSNGPFTFHFGHGWGHPRHCGWWGPPRYRPPYYRPPYHRPPHHRPPGHRPPGHRPPGQKPPGGGGKPSQLPADVGRPSTRPSDNSLYNRRPDGAAKDRQRPSTGDVKATRPAGQPSTRPNNVYTDKKGNIYRQDDKGWQQRQGNQWTRPSGGGTPSQTPSRPAGSVQQPSQRPSGSVQQPSQRPTKRPSSGQSWNSQKQSLERDRSSRNRGSQRTQQYQQKQQRSSRPTPRPAPSRGGGGRGRR